MPGYTVSDSRELSHMTPAGTDKKYYRVWLLTDEGATGYIDVSKKDWNKEKLTEILAVKAAELDLAFGL